MIKIENVDLREALGDIARNNTAWHLDNDLGISIWQMERAAKMDDLFEQKLIWISYPSGIDCYSEREVFQKDTRGYNGVQFHAKGTAYERKLAYVVEITDIQDEKLMGNLFEINLQEYGAFVQESAVASHDIRLFLTETYDHGEQTVMSKQDFDRAYPQELKEVKYWRHEPADPGVLQALLNQQYVTRFYETEPCDLWLHTSNLYEERLTFYSEKIMGAFSKLPEANGPDQQYFSVELPSFVANAFHPEQLSRLLDTLPFGNTAFSIRRGQRELHVEVPRDEMIRLREAETLAKEYHGILEDFAPWEYRSELEIENTDIPVFDTKEAKRAITQDACHIATGDEEAGYILTHLKELAQPSPEERDSSEPDIRAYHLHRRLAAYLEKHREQPAKALKDTVHKPSVLARLEEGKKAAVQETGHPKDTRKCDKGREV